MSIRSVFKGTLQSNAYSVTDELNNAVAFFLIAPDITFDVQIDVFLQLEINSFENRQIRLYEGLTENDTRTILTIPIEYERTNTVKKLALYCDFTVNIEVYVIEKDDSIDTDDILRIEDKINQLQSDLDYLKFTTDIINLETSLIAVNQVIQDQALAILGTGLAPITGGVSLGAIPLLESGATLLLPAL